MGRPGMLIIGAHPDDAEIGMGATIAKHTAEGFEVGICDLTRAELSSNGDVDTRAREAEEASKVLGLAYRDNLGLPDRGLAASEETIGQVVEEIRRRRPAIIFAPYWVDRHPDHVACSHLVQEAVFNAKLRRYHPESEAWLVERLYFYFINDVAVPDLAVDVSACYERKIQALSAYRSQFVSGGDTVATPLNQGYVERVQARDSLLGQSVKAGYAEGFMSKSPLIVQLFSQQES